MSAPQSDHKNVETDERKENHKGVSGKEVEREHTAHITEDVEDRCAIRVIVRHPRKHTVRPESVLSRFFIIIDKIFSPTLCTRHIALHQPFIVEYFRREVNDGQP